MSLNPLNSAQITDILQFLDVPDAQLTLDTLRGLIDGYVHRVPWESFSRIVRKAHTPEITARPRWPSEFWALAMSQGTGGTCFESNYAFWTLLVAIGFKGTLTINDMGETCACHSAIVVELDGEGETSQRYLVDVGLPIYTPIPLVTNETTTATSNYQQYTLEPVEASDPAAHYLVHRAPHPRPTAYTFIDRAVPEADYIQAVTQDYDEAGLFLNTAVITKVVDGVISRFSTHEQPYSLEFFDNGQRMPEALPEDLSAASAQISALFGIPVGMTYEALTLVESLKSDLRH